MPCFLKNIGGTELHFSFFRANLCANLCAELGYEFYNDIYADHVDMVSFKTPKRLSVAGLRAEAGGLCALSALYYTSTGPKSCIYLVFIAIFFMSEVLISVNSLYCRYEWAQAFRPCIVLGDCCQNAFAWVH